MILTDTKIKSMIERDKSIIENFDINSITNCGYDLSTYEFYTDQNSKVKTITLQPGCSIFVSSNEIISVPTTCCIRVVLKNSRIRQGLSLDAPIYQPGHKTRIFYRLTNVSSNAIELETNQKYASIIFDQLCGKPENPYTGTFSDEFSFQGMGAYQDTYEKQIQKVEKKKDELKDLEKKIYTNVSILLSIFIALFTLMATNVWGITKELSISSLLIIDFTLMGCISFLITLLTISLDANKKKIRLLIVFTIVFLALALFIFS